MRHHDESLLLSPLLHMKSIYAADAVSEGKVIEVGWRWLGVVWLGVVWYGLRRWKGMDGRMVGRSGKAGDDRMHVCGVEDGVK